MYGEMTPEEVCKKNEEIKSFLDKPCVECESETEWHHCPYALEIDGDDSDDYCKCCDTCMGQCAADI